MQREVIFDLLESTYAFAHRMIETARSWRNRESRTSPAESVALVRILIAACEQVGREVEAFYDRLNADGEHEDDFESDLGWVQGLNARVLGLQELAEVIEHSAHRSLHPVLCPTVETLLEALGVNGQVLVTGTSSRIIYELDRWERSHFSGLVPKEELDELTLPLLIFRVPEPPLDWPTHYCLLFHEVGHAVYETRRLSGQFAVAYPVEKPAADLEKQIDWADEQNNWAYVSGRWIEEVFADLFGLLAVGPAYFHSFCRVLAANSVLTDYTRRHPPTAFRINVMAKVMESRRLLEHLPSGARPAVSAWARIAERTDRTEDFTGQGDSQFETGFLRELLEAVRSKVPGIENAVCDMLRESVYAEPHAIEDLERAERIARLNIASVESDAVPNLDDTGVPLAPARIFASNWAAYFSERASRDRRAVKRMREHGERVLHSLDAAAAIREWRRVAK